MITTEKSLYVGDLAPDVTESDLCAKFSTAGRIQSVRICRHNKTKKSLGYGYVNFHEAADADKAMTLLNFDPLHNRPMRLMWAQRDPFLRRTGKGNIFVKNLNFSIGSKELYHIFAVFGKILSCKVAADENGSKGYGFVHYENEQSALEAISKINGTEISGQKVLVTKFVPQKERMNSRNVFVKNFGTSLDDEGLKNLFIQFGEIVNAKVMKDELDISKGFGFVCFKDASAAERAIAEMNGFILARKKLYVSCAQTAAERQKFLARERDLLPTEESDSDAITQFMNKYSKTNFACTNEKANSKPKEADIEADHDRTRSPNSLSAGKQLTKTSSPVSGRQQPSNGRSTSSHIKLFSPSPTDLKQGRSASNSPIPVSPPNELSTYNDLQKKTLASLSVTKQKKILDNLLYDQVMQITSNNAGKITGMLLELDTSDILYLLDSAPVLREKVQEAEQILWQQQEQEEQQQQPPSSWTWTSNAFTRGGRNPYEILKKKKKMKCTILYKKSRIIH